MKIEEFILGLFWLLCIAVIAHIVDTLWKMPSENGKIAALSITAMIFGIYLSLTGAELLHLHYPK